MRNQKWSREETILAFALYCRTPFGQMHNTNPFVIQLSKVIGRTPSAVSMKMCNFASFDAELQNRGIKGLVNASKLDRIIWDDFNDNLEFLSNEVKSIQNKISGLHLAKFSENIPAGLTKKQSIDARVNQDYFRFAVLAAYDNACCITGLNIPELLIASHIKPWVISNPETERTNPRNGLCLNALHDKAFDRGLITFDTNFQIVISKRIKEMYHSEIVSEYFIKYEGCKIRTPHRFFPLKEMLMYHNEEIFDKLNYL